MLISGIASTGHVVFQQLDCGIAATMNRFSCKCFCAMFLCTRLPNSLGPSEYFTTFTSADGNEPIAPSTCASHSLTLLETDDAGEVVVANLSSNEFIGEISILCDVPRTATVRASGKLQTLVIKKEHFLGLVQQIPDLGIEVMRELAARLSKTTAELGEARRKLGAIES